VLLGLALAVSEGASSSPDWVSQVLTWGPPGVMLVLLLTGVIEPKRAVTKAEEQTAKSDAETARWRSLFEAEQTAHQTTREALAVANERAAVAVENGKTSASILERLGHHAAQGLDRSPG
jgi:chitodextrinase